MNNQRAGNFLLTNAVSDLKKGFVVPAFATLDGLAKFDDFLLKGDAILYLAQAQGRIPSDEVLSNKMQTLEGLLNDKKTCKKDTTFWGVAITQQAEVYMAHREYDKARTLLRDASSVFSTQGSHPQGAIATHMLGALDVVAQDFVEAITKFELASTYASIETQLYVPTSWSITDKLVDREIALAGVGIS